ncbi:hypothetical protein GCM10010446_03450 [Streptomyces enissocaesilis]|uniref:Uncharacterized protein n=1 Tax=Streptomyces enissocaesilis TaxID=332589 RepID=A0ABP6J8N8_9ACTN
MGVYASRGVAEALADAEAEPDADAEGLRGAPVLPDGLAPPLSAASAVADPLPLGAAFFPGVLPGRVRPSPAGLPARLLEGATVGPENRFEPSDAPAPGPGSPAEAGPDEEDEEVNEVDRGEEAESGAERGAEVRAGVGSGARSPAYAPGAGSASTAATPTAANRTAMGLRLLCRDAPDRCVRRWDAGPSVTRRHTSGTPGHTKGAPAVLRAGPLPCIHTEPARTGQTLSSRPERGRNAPFGRPV